MLKKLLIFFNITIFINNIQCQCPIDLLRGQNLVTNGDFSQGYSSWSHTQDNMRVNGYMKFDPPNTQNYSSPGFIYVGSNPNYFNTAFNENLTDHSTSNDNMMLMVDGICVSGIKL